MEKDKNRLYFGSIILVFLALLSVNLYYIYFEKRFEKNEQTISRELVLNQEYLGSLDSTINKNKTYSKSDETINSMNITEIKDSISQQKTVKKSKKKVRSNQNINMDQNVSDDELVRVISYKNSDIRIMEDGGCQIISDKDKFDVLLCSKKNAKKFNLQEDMVLKALDVDANTQIGATDILEIQIGQQDALLEVPISISLVDVMVDDEFIKNEEDKISIHSDKNVKITVNSPVLVGATYKLYNKKDLFSGQWVELDRKTVNDTEEISFVQPLVLDQGYFKVIMEKPKVNLTGEGRTIVVLDSGYDYTHPDLVSSYLGGYDFVNKDSDPMDDNGHGSHIAGLITADGIANVSDRGVAPNVEIVSGKVLDNNGFGYFSDVLDAVYWAVDTYHPDAISLSMGSFEPNIYTDGCNDLYPAFTEAVKYANDHNVSFVAAAGNNGAGGVSFPGCISDSFTVGSVNNNDELAGFSGLGEGVDIYAPGVNLFSTWIKNDYNIVSGTSVSAPVVSGVIALMKQKNPNSSAENIQSKILETSDNFTSFYVDIKRINAFQAVNLI